MPARHSSWRDAALREMGLGPIWRRRDRLDDEPPANEAAMKNAAPWSAGKLREVQGDDVAAVPDVAARLAAPVAIASAQTPGGAPPATAHPAVSGRAHPRDQHADLSAPGVKPDQAARRARIADLDWAELEDEIRACRACVLCERRKQAVPGVGDRQARWMLVGEGPGAEEDQRGEPFVGQAGRLLDNMLGCIGLDRSKDVYIANAVKCRPPHNRTPERAELAACLPFLERQIALVQPKLLVALGRPAAQALLDREIAISAARGKLFDRGGIPVVVTYHPAYLLRNPHDKAKAWEDLCFARRAMTQAD